MKVKLYYSLSFKFDYRVLSEKFKIKYICESDHSLVKNDTLPKRCRPQKRLTSGGRERTPVKHHQGKA
jgi:hypothetical protein